jgi:hypothetical protein
MNDADPLASFSNFLFSAYGAIMLLVMLGLFALLWSDQIKRRWYDRIERKKWEQWNGPKAKQSRAVKREEPTEKR